MKEEAIENLEENYSRVEEKFYQGLLEWSRSPLAQNATTKTLCDALRQEACSKALETLSKEGIVKLILVSSKTISRNSIVFFWDSVNFIGSGTAFFYSPIERITRTQLPGGIPKKIG